MKDTKTVVIVGVLIAVIAMSIAYAAFASNLSIEGTAHVESNWDVKITNIVVKEKSANATSNSATNTDTTATFDCSLTQPGDYVIYTVTVANAGNIDAKVTKVPTFKAVSETNTNLTTSESTKYEDPQSGIVKFSLDGAPALNAELLKATSGTPTTTTFDVKVEYDEDATTAPTYTAKSATVEFTYGQK